MSYDPNTPSQPSYPPPPQNYGGDPATQGYGNAPAYGAPGGYPGGQPQAGNGIAIGGFVVSLVSIIFTGLIGIVLAVVAGILSYIGLQNAKKGAKYRGLALAGLIISIIVIVLSIILIVVGVGVIMSNN